MSHLSTEQQELRASIKKSATIWGVVLGGIVALLAYWIMGSQGAMVRIGVSAVGGLVVAIAMYNKSFKSSSASAQCGKCSAAFSISKSDSKETIVSTNDQKKVEAEDDGSTKTTTWTEETIDVVDSYTCAKCGDVTTKEYQRTNRKDEEVVVTPAKVTGSAKGGKGGKSGDDTADTPAKGGDSDKGSASSTKGDTPSGAVNSDSKADTAQSGKGSTKGSASSTK